MQSNSPALWRSTFPSFPPDAHKYDRGHTLVVGGGFATTGACRLSALAALRAGSGLVSIACDEKSLPIYAATSPSLMTKLCNDVHALIKRLEDKRISGVLIGPGAGVSEKTQQQTLAVLESKIPCVLDADALTSFENSPGLLFDALHPHCVLTPHEGEFARLFDLQGSRADKAQKAAEKAHCVVVLKGQETIMANPKKGWVMNSNAPSWLATAGSGDVLAGIITSLMAQHMPAYEAACAGVWLHSEAAKKYGWGMISEDLITAIPSSLQSLLAK